MRGRFPGAHRRLGPPRRSGRHAGGRHRDRRRCATTSRAATTRTPAGSSPRAAPRRAGRARHAPPWVGLLGARSRRRRLRGEHDDADVRVHPGGRPRRSRPATRSSAPVSTTTPTSPRGVRAAGGRRRHRDPSRRSTPTTGRLDADAVTELHRRAHPVGRDHRRVERARHDPGPRARSSPPRTRSAPGSSSTRCTSCRTAGSTSPRSAATCSRPPRTSGTARTPGCSGSSPELLAALDPDKVRPAPDDGPARARDRHPVVRGDRRRPCRRRVPAPRSTLDATETDGVRAVAHRVCSRCPTSRCTARTISTTARRRSLHRRRATTPTSSPRNSPRPASRCGAATTTPSRSWRRSASTRRAARSAPGSPATPTPDDVDRLLDVVDGLR